MIQFRHPVKTFADELCAEDSCDERPTATVLWAKGNGMPVKGEVVGVTTKNLCLDHAVKFVVRYAKADRDTRSRVERIADRHRRN